MIDRTIGRFRIVEKIGEGGMATVWKAHDELMDHTVALKVLADALAHSREARRRFRHEAEIASRLDHPAIAKVYAYGGEEGATYLAMAFIDGETVTDKLEHRLMPIEEAVEIAATAADALGYAHAHGVVHRDMSSRNVMVARDGRIFVLDFGLALAAGLSRVTSQGTTVGTIAYLAPELILGEEADVRTDLYGLGVVFFEALTGTLPFKGKTADIIKYAALNQEPRSPRELRPEISRDLERVVLKLLARDAGERYQTAAEVVADLRGAVAESRGDRSGPLSAGTQRLTQGDQVYLAVVPFETEPGDDQVLLGHGLVEVLRSSLASVGRIHVVASGKERPASDAKQDIQAFARRIGCHILLRGSIRCRGSQLKVEFSFIDPDGGARIGGGAVSGSTTEIFDFEDRVVSAVRDALGQQRPSTHGVVVPRSPDPAAQDRYRQALGYLKRYDNEASIDGAIRLLEKLSASSQDSATYHATLARAYSRKYQLVQEHVWEARAASSLESARRLAPRDPDVLLALGDIQLASGRYEQARATFGEALRRCEDGFEALLGIGQACGRMGSMDEAEEASLKAVAHRPHDWRGHSLLGWVRFQRGDFSRAIEPWQRVVALTPDNAKGQRNLGSGLYRLNRFDEAIEAYERSLTIQPNAEAYGNLGTALYFMGRHDEAIQALRRSTELAPSDPIRWGNLGNACVHVGERFDLNYESEATSALDRAIDLMRERLERNPNEAYWLTNLAGWLANRDRESEARSAIQKALELADWDVRCMVGAGHVFLQLNDRQECLRWLRLAVESGYGVGELARSLELSPLHNDPEFLVLLDGYSPLDSTSGSSGSEGTDGKTWLRKGGRDA